MEAPKKYNLALTRPGFAGLLADELRDLKKLEGTVENPAALRFEENVNLPPLAETIFARQFLPRAALLKASDDGETVAFIVKRLEIMAGRGNRQSGSWTLHAFALDDDPALHRAMALEKAVLAALKIKLPKLLKRYVAPLEFSADPRQREDVLIQLYVSALDEVWMSIASMASGVSLFIGGNQRMRHRQGSPSRSSSKLEEAFVCLGHEPKPGDSAVDLGAAPGGWTFTLARHGANVTAVDHGELDLPKDKKLRGEVLHLKDNGLKYFPEQPVDWLCCDMVIASRETLRVLDAWMEKGWMKHFVVNVKLPQAQPWPVIKEAVALLQKHAWPIAKAKHLYHDRQEITLVGSRDL